MALKPDRNLRNIEVTYFNQNITNGGDRGGIVVSTGGTVPSGAAMDQTVNKCVYVANPSGYKPLGFQLSNVVNIDLNRQKLNPFDSEVLVGDKVPVLTQGWVVTNMVNLTGTEGGAVAVGKSAYLAGSGYITTDSKEGRPLIGKFLSKADEDGYYKVQVDL